MFCSDGAVRDEQTVEQRVARVALAGLRDHAGGFVHHQEQRIGVHDAQGHARVGLDAELRALRAGGLGGFGGRRRGFGGRRRGLRGSARRRCGFGAPSRRALAATLDAGRRALRGRRRGVVALVVVARAPSEDVVAVTVLTVVQPGRVFARGLRGRGVRIPAGRAGLAGGAGGAARVRPAAGLGALARWFGARDAAAARGGRVVVRAVHPGAAAAAFAVRQLLDPRFARAGLGRALLRAAGSGRFSGATGARRLATGRFARRRFATGAGGRLAGGFTGSSAGLGGPGGFLIGRRWGTGRHARSIDDCTGRTSLFREPVDRRGVRNVRGNNDPGRPRVPLEAPCG
jgi:hypothetical protein